MGGSTTGLKILLCQLTAGIIGRALCCELMMSY